MEIYCGQSFQAKMRSIWILHRKEILWKNGEEIMSNIVCLLFGIILGSIAGVLVSSLCVSAKSFSEDEINDTYLR